MKTLHGPGGGYTSPIWTLTPDEQRAVIEASRRAREFTSGHRTNLAVRMAFWELVAAEVWS